MLFFWLFCVYYLFPKTLKEKHLIRKLLFFKFVYRLSECTVYDIERVFPDKIIKEKKNTLWYDKIFNFIVKNTSFKFFNVILLIRKRIVFMYAFKVELSVGEAWAVGIIGIYACISSNG